MKSHTKFRHIYGKNGLRGLQSFVTLFLCCLPRLEMVEITSLTEICYYKVKINTQVT